jgi:tellurite resistance protein
MMDSKVAFGYDSLYVMRTLELSGGESIDPIADAAVQFFLITWGFSVDEVDEANKAFWNDFENKKLPDFDEVVKRLFQHVQKDHQAVERLLINSIAVAYIDGDFTKDEVEMIRMISNGLDFRPSELEEHLKTGMQLAFGLNFFGTSYEKNK